LCFVSWWSWRPVRSARLCLARGSAESRKISQPLVLRPRARHSLALPGRRPFWSVFMLRRLPFLVLLSLCPAVLLAAQPAKDAVAENKAADDQAIARVYPALVRILVVVTQARDGRLEKHQGAGSGVIVSADGYVVTNHHVAGKARHIVCDLADGERIEA